MNSTNNTALNKKIYWFAIMFVTAIFFAVISSSQIARRYLNIENGEKRFILAKIFTQINEKKYVIFKIRTDEGVLVEIYEKDNQTYFQKLKQKIIFPGDKNAFLMINENSVMLALSDIDKNGINEIIIPTVDQYGISRLNIFKYDQDLNQFSQSVASE